MKTAYDIMQEIESKNMRDGKEHSWTVEWQKHNKRRLIALQIKYFMRQNGLCSAAMRRCRNANSELYKKYEKAEMDFENLADDLIVELLLV